MEPVLGQEDTQLITLKYPCMYQERLPHMQINPMHVVKLQAVCPLIGHSSSSTCISRSHILFAEATMDSALDKSFAA